MSLKTIKTYGGHPHCGLENNRNISRSSPLCAEKHMEINKQKRNGETIAIKCANLNNIRFSKEQCKLISHHVQE